MPKFPIERAEHPLNVGHHRLGLDDEQRRCRWVPGEEVDRAAIASDVECHLGHDRPAGVSEEYEHLLHQTGVIGIEQSIGGFALPIDPNDESSVEGLHDPIKPVQAEPSSATALDPCDQ